MADYFEPTIIQQSIPDADMTPLERLLLSNIFEAEPDGDGWCFFSEQGPATMIAISRAELETALAGSQTAISEANAYIAEQLAPLPSDQVEVDLDLSGTSWEFLFQNIVRRSPRLRYVTAVTSFTCSNMRPDGFGRLAVLITSDAIVGKSTNDILEDFLAEVGLDGEDTAPSA